MGSAVFRIAQLISVMTLFQTTTTSHKSTLTKWHTKEHNVNLNVKVKSWSKKKTLPKALLTEVLPTFTKSNNKKQICVSLSWVKFGRKPNPRVQIFALLLASKSGPKFTINIIGSINSNRITGINYNININMVSFLPEAWKTGY